MALTKQNMFHKDDSAQVSPDKPAPVATIDFSFDDGYLYDMQVAQILDKYKLKGTFYIIVDAVDKNGFMSWNDIKLLDAQGHHIGSHTVTHPQDLKVLYEQELHYEVQNSKDMLETVLGHNIDSFCYPRGRFDERVKMYVANAGYVTARVTGDPGKTTVEDKLALPGTVQIFPREKYGDMSILDYAKAQIDKVRKEGGYCNIWAHSKDIQEKNLWQTLEDICKYVSEQ